MYVNVDSAIKLFKKLAAHITDNNDMRMTQSKADLCVFFKLDDQIKIRLIFSITVDECAITSKNEQIECLMNGIENSFKITRDRIITKHLGVEYEWVKTKDRRNFCKAVMNNKIEATINHYEKYIGKKVKVYRTPRIPHEISDKNYAYPTYFYQNRSLVGKIIFFSTKVGVKTVASIRSASFFCRIQ